MWRQIKINQVTQQSEKLLIVERNMKSTYVSILAIANIGVSLVAILHFIYFGVLAKFR